MSNCLRLSLLVAGALVLSCESGAVAQDALGDGTALDGNLQEGSGGFNRSRRSVRAQVALRNSIATGNAPAGMSFRGDVGYQAANDFRRELTAFGADDLGSDDLYPWLRESYSSYLAARDVRGIGAIQQQFRHAIGGQYDDMTGAVIVDRPASSMSADFVDNRAGSAAQAFDVFGNIRGSLRSTSEYHLQRAARPDVIGQVQRAGVPMYISASPLQGVTTLPTDNSAFREGSNREEIIAAARRAARVENDAVGDAVGGEAVSTHATVLQSLRNRVETNEELRARLLAERTAELEATDPDVEPVEPVAPNEPFIEEIDLEDELEEIRRRLLGQPVGDPEEEETTFEELSRRAAELLGGEGPVVEELIPEVGAGAVFARHIERGQLALQEGRWFDAEERFTAALGIKRGNATAAIGRIHAQLGAGMFLSASINLRNLYQAYPEMIAVRFDEALLPRGDRLTRVEELLATNVMRDSTTGLDAALLLAYLGRQYQDREMMLLGINRMSAIRQAIEEPVDPLETLLRDAWID